MVDGKGSEVECWTSGRGFGRVAQARDIKALELGPFELAKPRDDATAIFVSLSVRRMASRPCSRAVHRKLPGIQSNFSSRTGTRGIVPIAPARRVRVHQILVADGHRLWGSYESRRQQPQSRRHQPTQQPQKYSVNFHCQSPSLTCHPVPVSTAGPRALLSTPTPSRPILHSPQSDTLCGPAASAGTNSNPRRCQLIRHHTLDPRERPPDVDHTCNASESQQLTNYAHTLQRRTMVKVLDGFHLRQG